MWKLVPVVLLAFVAACAPGPGAPPATTPASTASASTASASTASATTAPATTAELITVPDVSGMNHQDAQNRMQAAGLYNLREVDGTGQGRALVLDRNWVQVAQDPPAGAKVPKDTVITLTAIKYTDR